MPMMLFLLLLPAMQPALSAEPEALPSAHATLYAEAGSQSATSDWEADPGLAAAAAEARESTGGKVLSAERRDVDGKPYYRVRVLTPDGRIRILDLEAQ